ncbi:TPA: hypothetical protein ACNVM6_002660 [Citrobacter amalonaticus]|nr:hypothetical protein [Citrobacter amalonaticus]
MFFIAAFIRSFALLTAFFYNWQEKYKKHPVLAHRARTQHLGNVSLMFMAKAQGDGSDFTEMKTYNGNRAGLTWKRQECETGRLTQ